MRILLAFNYYQKPGGEDIVFDLEKKILQQAGHHIVPYTESNKRIDAMTWFSASRQTIWSSHSYRAIRQLINDEKPDIAYFHNTFLLISPSAYYACQDSGIPVVQTIQNYRLLCPAANFLRNDRICQDCLGKTPPWPAILHKCYRNSRLQTSVVSAMLTIHRWRRTWQEQVDFYIPPTDFLRMELAKGGIPVEKIIVKPNFQYPDIPQQETNGDSALFVGRFSQEKGVRFLTQAWRLLKDIPIRLAGAGPLLDEITRLIDIHEIPHLDLLGWRSHEEVLNLIRGARFLIVPSLCFEGFPLIMIEAFACGVPVIASRLGAMSEIVDDHSTGLLFTAGDELDLAEKVRWAWTHPEQMVKMGKEARREYEKKYTAKRNYEILMDIYERALRDHAKGLK
jgi:glycosyltransferase involved in cell wall biosynthesis